MDIDVARALNGALIESRAAIAVARIWRLLRLRIVWQGLALLGLGFMLAWYLALEKSWLSYPALPFQPKAAVFHPGEPVLLSVTRCNSSSIERQYNLSHVLTRLDPPTEACPRRTILPPGLVPIDGATPENPSGCVTSDSAANPIPKTSCSGLYMVEGNAETQATIRTVLVHWYSAPFRIEAAASAASSP